MKRSLTATILSTALTLSLIGGVIPGEVCNAATIPGSVGDSEEEYKWTVLCYFCGSDLESWDEECGCASEDIIEMMDATTGCDDVRFVVRTGGSDCDHEYFKNDSTLTFVIENGEATSVGKTELRDMGETDTLKDFLKYGVEMYPAEHTAVILWNHGGGAMGGCCYDELFEDSHLTLPEMRDAFDEACAGYDKKLDFIAYDCCNMACLELANILTPYADYFIASQETMPGTGFDYVGFGSYLCEHSDSDAETAGLKLCECYWQEGIDLYDSDGITVSMTDLNAMEEFMVDFREFCEGLSDVSGSFEGRDDFIDELGASGDFGFGTYDLATFLDICAPYTTDGEELSSELERTVIYAQGTGSRGSYSGLSIYIPMFGFFDDEEKELFSEICVDRHFLKFVGSMPWIDIAA